jgi:hypothetical protein
MARTGGAQLAGLSLPKDVDRILDLGPPEEEFRDDFDDPGRVLLARFRELWCCLTTPDGVVESLIEPTDDDQGTGRFWSLFAKLGMYYGYLARRDATTDPQEFFQWTNTAACAEPLIPAPAVSADEAAEPEAPKERLEWLRAKRARNIRAIAHRQSAAEIRGFDAPLLSLMMPHVAYRTADTPEEVAQLEINLEAEMLSAYADLLERIRESTGPLREMLEHQLQQLLEYGSYIYLEERKDFASAPESAFSDRWLDKLVQMSRRNPRLAERDGLKNLEKQFERNLSLLLQTLGLQTVPALSGEEAADILCVARAGQTKFTMLVDAKSGKAPYALPKADQRAIADYVRQTVGSLADLPDLRCVLIVGHGPAGTVAGKLQTLETRIGVPLRFIDAVGLADLRKQMSGPVRADLLLQMLLEAGPVIGADDLKKLRERHSRLEATFVEFVRGMRQAAPAV